MSTARDIEPAAIVPSITSEGVEISLETARCPFEEYYEDQSKLDPKNRTGLILLCSMAGIVSNFSLSSLHENPFKEQNIHTLKPTKPMVKDEIKRRVPSKNKLSSAKLNDLIDILRTTNDILTDECKAFITKKFKEIKELFQKLVNEK